MSFVFRLYLQSIRERINIIKQCLFSKVVCFNINNNEIHPDFKKEIIDEYFKNLEVSTKKIFKKEKRLKK
jgi:hypothetical protein